MVNSISGFLSIVSTDFLGKNTFSIEKDLIFKWIRFNQAICIWFTKFSVQNSALLFPRYPPIPSVSIFICLYANAGFHKIVCGCLCTSEYIRSMTIRNAGCIGVCATLTRNHLHLLSPSRQIFVSDCTLTEFRNMKWIGYALYANYGHSTYKHWTIPIYECSALGLRTIIYLSNRFWNEQHDNNHEKCSHESRNYLCGMVFSVVFTAYKYYAMQMKKQWISYKNKRSSCGLTVHMSMAVLVANDVQLLNDGVWCQCSDLSFSSCYHMPFDVHNALGSIYIEWIWYICIAAKLAIFIKKNYIVHLKRIMTFSLNIDSNFFLSVEIPWNCLNIYLIDQMQGLIYCMHDDDFYCLRVDFRCGYRIQNTRTYHLFM